MLYGDWTPNLVYLHFLHLILLVFITGSWSPRDAGEGFGYTGHRVQGYGVYGADMGYMGWPSAQAPASQDVYGAPSSGYMEQEEN